MILKNISFFFEILQSFDSRTLPRTNNESAQSSVPRSRSLHTNISANSHTNLKVDEDVRPSTSSSTKKRAPPPPQSTTSTSSLANPVEENTTPMRATVTLANQSVTRSRTSSHSSGISETPGTLSKPLRKKKKAPAPPVPQQVTLNREEEGIYFLSCYIISKCIRNTLCSSNSKKKKNLKLFYLQRISQINNSPRYVYPFTAEVDHSTKDKDEILKDNSSNHSEPIVAVHSPPPTHSEEISIRSAKTGELFNDERVQKTITSAESYESLSDMSDSNWERENDIVDELNITSQKRTNVSNNKISSNQFSVERDAVLKTRLDV